MHTKPFLNPISIEGRSATMKTTARAIAAALAVGACLAPGAASAFTSGSTGVDGAFNPTVNTTVTLPPSGIFNYTSVLIPAGVTVTYARNTTNTPIVILVTGDVIINGTLNVSGAIGANVGAAGDGSLGDDGAPGTGGPGGYDGGRGGQTGSFRSGGFGLGPGGGQGGIVAPPASGGCFNSGVLFGGGGGGYANAGSNAICSGTFGAIGGPAYGTAQILPLLGGSGGGGGTGGATFVGTGGGGGGGAILIAASGGVGINGSILANGGNGGNELTTNNSGTGGGGAGGAIRILATTINGNGTLSATGGVAGTGASFNGTGSNGSVGRIRLEYETTTRTAVSNPAHTQLTPGQPVGPVFVAGSPTLTISSVAGISAPTNPTGNADITLPSTTPNPVTVVFTTAGVPVGNIVQLTVTPAYGAAVTAVSPALSGSTAGATASVSINLPVGPSVLSAQTTFTIVAALGDLLRNFAGNERVEKVTLVATLGGASKMKLITVSGKEYDAPPEALRIASLGG
jgi:hypothetical protein